MVKKKLLNAILILVLYNIVFFLAYILVNQLLDIIIENKFSYQYFSDLIRSKYFILFYWLFLIILIIYQNLPIEKYFHLSKYKFDFQIDHLDRLQQIIEGYNNNINNKEYQFLKNQKLKVQDGKFTLEDKSFKGYNIQVQMNHNAELGTYNYLIIGPRLMIKLIEKIFIEKFYKKLE